MIKKKISQILLLLFLCLSFSQMLKQLKSVLRTLVGVFLNLIWLFDMILEPVAKGYNKLPEQIKKGTGNFTSNISTFLSIPNTLLQGNFKQFGHATGSVIVNTSIGILGLFNPAEKFGLKPHKEDVGQTLATYGIGSGCYFVLPICVYQLLGTLFGLLADTYIDPFVSHHTKRKECLELLEIVQIIIL